MQYIKLGRTGLDVSPIAIGAMTYGEPERGHPAWSLGEDESRLLVKHAVEAGINLFDTANLYSLGSSEEILGRALKGRLARPRDEARATARSQTDGWYADLLYPPPTEESLHAAVRLPGRV